MDATLITGFLGAGKTTALKRILREDAGRLGLGVIVNDLSELEVDGELLRMSEAVSESNGTLVSLTQGLISDARRADFRQALAGMQERNIRHLLIEASGAADVLPVIEDILSSGATLRSVVAFVDARALFHDYDGGQDLLPPRSHQNALAGLLISQIQAASVIAVTKSDLVPLPELENVLRVLTVLQPAATVVPCEYGKLDVRCLLDAEPYTMRQVARPSADCEIGNSILRDRRPFHPQRLYDHYRTGLGLGIFRSKGFLWLASRPDDVLLWNQAGGAMGLEFLGTWCAAAVAAGGLLPEEKCELERRLAEADPLFGDRGNELTIIGTARDREVFLSGLLDCLCRQEEVEAWKNGGTFLDPWPKVLRPVV